MSESVPVRCPACRRERVHTVPSYPCACGAPVTPVPDRRAAPTAVVHRTWDEQWISLRCDACGRRGQWPHPELGCPCGTVLRIPVTGACRPATREPGSETKPAPAPDTTSEPVSTSAASREPASTSNAVPEAVSTSDAPRELTPPSDTVPKAVSPSDAPREPASTSDAAPEAVSTSDTAPEAVPSSDTAPEASSPEDAPEPASTSDTAPETVSTSETAKETVPPPETAPEPDPPTGTSPEPLSAPGAAAAPARATGRPGFRSVVIRTALDAVTAAVLHLRRLGHRDVRRADQRPTSGIGLAARGLLAQVDPSVRPASLRDVECLWLTAMTECADCVYFSLAGYTEEARAGADRLGVPLFVLDLGGGLQPVNAAADALDAEDARGG